MGITKFEMNVPTFIRDALARVRQADPGAIVAGGCLRDTVFGVPVKDVDVFVTGAFDPARLPVFGGAPNHELFYEERGIGMISYGSGGGHRGPLEGWCLLMGDQDTPPVQVIRREFSDIADLMSDLDFGFCQIAFDGADVWVSDQFMRDRSDCHATYTFPDGEDRFGRAYRRAERLKVKYPAWSFVCPSQGPLVATA